MTADFLDTKRSEIAARLKELAPLVDEYRRLEAAAAALDGLGAPGPADGRATRRRGGAPAGTARRGRPRGSGTRAGQALALVRTRPGITIPEMAGEMGIKQNYLYRVLPGLERDGLVARDGRGWRIRDEAAAS